PYSMFQLHLHNAGANGSAQRCVIALRLVGIGERELAHRLVELVALSPEVSADRPRVTRLGMRPRQRPTAKLPIDRQHLRIIGLNQWRELHVSQLADVEMSALGTGAPAEEQVGRRLHQLLALDHPLAVLSVDALTGIGLQYRGVSLLELQ